MRRKAGLSLLVALLFLLAPTAEAQRDRREGRRFKPFDIDLAIQRADPETLRGPVCLMLDNVNRLRYDIALGSDVEITAGPSLAGFAFIPAFPEETGTEETAPAPPPPPPPLAPQAAADAEDTVTEADLVEQEIAAHEKTLGTIATDIDDLIKEAEAASDLLGVRQALVLELVARSDQVLASQGGAALFQEVILQREGLGKDLANARWPKATSIEDVRGRLEGLKGKVGDIHVRRPGFSEWVNRSAANLLRYERLKRSTEGLSKALASIEPESDNFKQFNTTYNNLFQWSTKIAGIASPDSFTEELCVPCGHPFLKNKEVQVKLIKVDRTAEDAAEAETTEVIATVDCPTALTFSGGMGVSGLEEREFALIPQTDGSGLQIAYKDQGSQQVNPVILFNTRLSDHQQYNWHVTAGTVLDVDNPDSGVAIGYILGGSFSFRDNFYLTAGLQFGRVHKLADGFKLGDVPDGVAEPPLERKWDQDWVLAATFKIR